MINNSKESLYVQRLFDLMDSNDPQASQLGLLRIADICKYKLDYKFDGNNVEVIAIKDLKG